MAKGYWDKRQTMIYYRYLDQIVRGVAADCMSMIDVGSHNTPLIERFKWVKNRVALDLVRPYKSKRVRGIKTDFFEYKPETPFDIATCFQVLEHVPDAGAFAKHLFEVGRRVLISVPYLWEAGSTKGHIHDPVDLEKLTQWTGRDPAYHLIVQEPLIEGGKGRRLIAYYPAPGEEFSLGGARAAAKATLKKGKDRKRRKKKREKKKKAA
jgi:hypothetical protein